ncbi:2-oxo acid dehydrogenase subunit E2 [Candidatus Izimaplasma bacterium]|nr:2-oxo acid dehydrogenase subunit E2 [Candidatus Izimaplasma bacterium]
MKKRFGDRNDGYKLRKVDPFFRVIPHIMKDRNDAQVFFEERIYLVNSQKLIRKLRAEGYKLGFLHVVLASMVRVISQKPKINRFVAGKRTYARNEISFSLAVKKEMSEDAEETTIKVKFDPKDTIYDVCDKLNKEIDINKGESVDKNSTDKLAKFFSLFPNTILSMLVWTVKKFDKHGWLPKSFIDSMPFHSSIFITDLGSLGIKPVFHHLYNFGTTTIFIAFGLRTKEQVIEDGLNVKNKKVMDLKFVVDERVVDGYYFASAIKLANKIMANPEVLLLPPEEVFEDDEI